MQAVKELVNRGIRQIKEIDITDRKTQIILVVSGITTIYIVIGLSRKRNFWDEITPYRAATSDELGDPRELAKIKRCGKPSDMLDIAFGTTGPAAMRPQTIHEIWQEALINGGDSAMIGIEELQQDGTWKYQFTSWRQADNEFNRIGKALIGLGIKQFDICNIIGGCTPMFHYLFFGVIFSGAVPGGCYTTNLSGSLKYICNLCKTKVVFAENKMQLNKYMDVIDELETVKYIIVYDDDDEKKEYDEYNNNKKGIKIISFGEFMKFGENNVDELNKELEARKKSVSPKQCAILLYTSGTTGGSKGCMLSHDNVVSMTNMAEKSYVERGGGILPTEGVRQISFLPLSHIAGQTLSWWNPIHYMAKLNIPCTTYYCRKDWKKTMKFSLGACNPTAFIAVPRLYEKFYEAMIAGLANASFIKKSIFNFCLWIGRDYYYNTQAGGSGDIPYLWSFVKRKLCDGAIKKGIGFGSCDSFVSGGAPLAPKIRETFAALGMPIVDAYGMSETCGAIAVSRPNNYVPGACGPVVMGSQLIIDHKQGRDEGNQGEICYRGRAAMMGYINELEKTEKTFDKNGYIHTGDIGYIDKYDCLHITGRIKELLVTAGGENVAPVPVETFIKKVCPALSQVIMIGDKKKYCSIIVSIACKETNDGIPTSQLQEHAKLVNPNINTIEDAINDYKWHEYLRKGCKEYNNNKAICVSNSCRIQYFQILHKDLCVVDGTLAASLKVKRHKLYHVYKKEMDALYGDNPSIPVIPRR